MRRDFFFKHFKIIFLSQLYIAGRPRTRGWSKLGEFPITARYGRRRASGRPAASAASVPSYGTSKTPPVA